MPAIPGYRVISHLADGGFGSVFRAEPAAGGAPVVIKIARTGRVGADTYLAKEIAVLTSVGAPSGTAPPGPDAGR